MSPKAETKESRVESLQNANCLAFCSGKIFTNPFKIDGTAPYLTSSLEIHLRINGLEHTQKFKKQSLTKAYTLLIDWSEKEINATSSL